MEFTVTKKYMTLPSGKVDNKKVLFYLDGALVYDLDVNLADGGRFCFTSRFPYDETERTITVQVQKSVPDAQMTVFELHNIWQ